MRPGRLITERLRSISLAGRLILLAAGWSVAALVVTGIALSALFHQAALSRFDLALTDTVDALYAGSTVGPGGQVIAPALTDARALRAYSGKYWQITAPTQDGRLLPSSPAWPRSRSLWDSELSAPRALSSGCGALPGRACRSTRSAPWANRCAASA